MASTSEQGTTATGFAPARQPMIEFNGVTKSFLGGNRKVDAIVDVELTVREGEFLAIVGPSGCGKSTLLNMTAGLMGPTRGEVRYRGHPVAGVNTRVGYVTQRDDLLPWRTVLANVTLPLEIQEVPRRERRQRALDAIELVGLTGFDAHYPAQLSGGMRKRVNLARTLVYDPETLLLDEPFGALDAQLRLLLQQELLDLLQGTQKTVILVTHDLAEAVVLADRVVVFGTKPGRVLAIEEVPMSRPRDLEAERFSPTAGRVQEKLWSYLRSEVSKGAEV
ncbi:MAG TPA: ABC transporter ATP-binding protein [Solirubrobacteraceae bacterium]|nr:ABC transporter ATP-binding protein [Solirubrobacteraceae bacterium]